MLALTLPIACPAGSDHPPLVRIAFDFEPRRPSLWCGRRAFLLGLMGHTWLEVGCDHSMPGRMPRTPLVAAFLQAIAYILLALWLSRTVGHTGLALADTFSFTGQALLLLFLLNRVYPGVLQVSNTLVRAILGAIVGGGLAFLILRFLPLPLLPLSLGALAVGGLAALPFIWTEVKLLVKL
jgi:peptidoglycan biosynthesis protein MviN/MurJ (putative lipid II flippase)